jgi:hypothetical protein
MQEVLPPAPQRASDVSVAAFGGIVMAQKVDQRRNLRDVEKEIMAVCAAYGDSFYYAWDVKDRQGKTTTVEGVSVDGASVLRQIWRNNMCETIVLKDDGEFVYFASRFVDYETGNTIIRPFKQRTGMKFGKMQKDRIMETTFSIGVSKSERNVTLDALRIQREQMLKYAKDNLRSKIEKNPEKSKVRIFEIAKELNIPTDKLERYVERKEKDWVSSSMVRLVQALKAIQEGDATVDDVFGQEITEGDLGEGQDQGGQPATEQKGPAKATTKEETKKEPDKRPAAAAGKKAEPAKSMQEPEQEPKQQARSQPAEQQPPADNRPTDEDPVAEQQGFGWLSPGDDDLGN